jgi:protein-S-isoprenylcysteine O-methyltransferase Ste14
VLWALYASAGVTFFAAGRIAAPYGRHARPGWGPVLPKRLGWIVMESPSIVLFAVLFLAGPRADQWIPRLFALLWLVHYVHRGVVYPLLLRGAAGKTIPWVVIVLALTFNSMNSFVNARSLSSLGPIYDARWLLSFRFLYGLLLFVTGFVINRWADAALARIRRRTETGYQVPHGGLFEEVSCPNYLGELIQWTGWAIMTWSPAGFAFAVFTAANLVPRAVSHHRWYRRNFPAYPRRRRALIPYIL